MRWSPASTPAFATRARLRTAVSLERHVSPKLIVSTRLSAQQLLAAGAAAGREPAAARRFHRCGRTGYSRPRGPSRAVGRLLVAQSTAHSSYDAGYLSINAPFSRRTTLLANYTLSRTRDDDSSTGPYSPVTAVNPYQLRQEAAFSSLDQRHVLNVNAIVNLPAGFKLNPLFQAHSGAPYTPIVGFDTQNDANDWNARAVVNGKMVPRNVDRQPLFADLDLRVVKDFTLKGEGHHLDLFMDVFNLPGAGNRRFDGDGLSLLRRQRPPGRLGGSAAVFAPGVDAAGRSA